MSAVDLPRIVIAELLSAEDAREEPYSIENLVTNLRNLGSRHYF